MAQKSHDNSKDGKQKVENPAEEVEATEKPLNIKKIIFTILSIFIIFFMLPVVIYFSPLIKNEVFTFSDIRHWYFLFVFVSLFALSFYVMQRAKTNTEQFIHATLLLVAIASFYAFGFPKELLTNHSLSAEAQAEALGHRYAELCVILVLFLLSELAVKLTYDAASIRKNISDEAHKIITEITQEAQKIGENLSNASKPISDAKDVIGNSAEIIKSSNLNQSIENMKILQNRLQSFFPILDAALKFPNPELQGIALDTATKWTKAWGNLFSQLETNEHKTKCMQIFFREYVNNEVDRFNLKLSLPERLLKSSGASYRLIDISDGDIKISPIIYSTADQYSHLLSSIADAVNHIINTLKRETPAAPIKILYRAISNLLPYEWFNWQYNDNPFYFFNGLENYAFTLRQILKSDIEMDYQRFIVVDQENGHRLRWDLLHPYLQGSTKNIYQSANKNGLSSVLGTEDDLAIDLNDFYCLIFGKHQEVSENSFDFNSLSPNELISKLNSIATSVRQCLKAKNPLWKDEKVNGSSHVTKRFDVYLRKNDDKIKVYPILHLHELEQLGIGNLNEHWKDGQPFTYNINMDFEPIKVIPLKEEFLKYLGSKEKNCRVICLDTVNDLKLFPDAKSDILSIGYKIEDNDNWLLALATALIPGENILSMRIITDENLLRHISYLTQYFEQNKKVKKMESINVKEKHRKSMIK